MDYADLSDLEEGEILEYESLSPSDSRCDDFGIKSCSFCSLRKECKNCNFELKRNQENDFYLNEKSRNGNLRQSLNNKLKFVEKVEDMKSNMSMCDLESISSEEEHKSNEENKYSGGNKKYTIYSENKNKKKFYGTIEDIMSEIGETICRKSRCNYKKRKSKEAPCNLNKYSDKSYDLWSHKTFSSHLKNKKRKRNVSFSDSDSDSARDKINKRKKKKRKRLHCERDKKSKKSLRVGDFDKVRQTLERLKNQKAEKKSKASPKCCGPEIESSEIQEEDMLIDCTNYVDNTRDAAPEDSNEKGVIEEEEREDELDLIKLRLIALASNKKQRSGEPASKSVAAEEVSGEEKSFDRKKEEMDLDRNELLLRAEALKTALLKKHQKRLIRLKVKKTNVIESAKDKDESNSAVGSMNCSSSDIVAEILDADACKENVKEESENEAVGNSSHASDTETKINEPSETPAVCVGGLKKTHPRPRTKRKKRKSSSYANNVGENSEKSEAFEEDDRALRSQLLSDLLKKKSLKDSEEKSVVANSIQMTASKPLPSAISSQSSKESEKPLPVATKTSVKKVNPVRTVKPATVAKIPKAEIQRIIVHLGSEDSSDEDEAPCEASPGVERKESQEKEKKSKEGDVMKSTHVNKTVQADYERSVELLLSQARKKIEGEKRTADESALATPEAVYKHLPPSQRLEYIRLKQKIAERERLRKERTENSERTFVPVDSKAPQISTKETPKGKEPVENFSEEFKVKPENAVKVAARPAGFPSNGNLVYKNNLSLSKPLIVLNSPSSTGECPTNLNGLKRKGPSQRRVINKTKNNFETVCGKNSKPEVSIRQSRLLLPSSQALISKLKLLLKKIKIEKIIEENYDKEIVKLKNQLSLLENKKSEQRFKIKQLGEESMKTYKAIQSITTKANEKAVPIEDEVTRENKEGGGSESKDERKKPEKEEGAEGKIVSNKPEMELSKGLLVQNETDKRLNNGDKISEVADKGMPAGVCLLDYHSPLQVFNKVSDCSERVNPNVVMCQFDLTGICKDEECAYQHLRAS